MTKSKCLSCTEKAWSDKYLANERKRVFTRCLVRKLTRLPLLGEYPSGSISQISKLFRRHARAKEFEKEVYDVLLGNKSIEFLFYNVTRACDVDKHKLLRMFFDCFQHLTSEEAEKVVEEWRIFLNK